MNTIKNFLYIYISMFLFIFGVNELKNFLVNSSIINGLAVGLSAEYISRLILENQILYWTLLFEQITLMIFILLIIHFVFTHLDKQKKILISLIIIFIGFFILLPFIESDSSTINALFIHNNVLNDDIKREILKTIPPNSYAHDESSVSNYLFNDYELKQFFEQ